MFKKINCKLIIILTFSFYSCATEQFTCVNNETNSTFIGVGDYVAENNAALENVGEKLLNHINTLLLNAQEQTSVIKEIARHIINEKPVANQEVLSSSDSADKKLIGGGCYNQTVIIRQPLPSTCAEAAAISRKTGIYNIQVDSYSPKPFQVACDEDLHGGGWTVVLRRRDGSVDFFRDWAEYKRGFGNLEGEFFIGLDKLHALTSSHYVQELLFVLEDFDNTRKYANYTSFAVGNESERYNLKTLGKYAGDAGDSFTGHAGHPFKTKDIEDPHKCATQYIGAWWYTQCHSSNLNGKYMSGAYGQEKFAQGVVWQAWRGYNYSLKFVQMMIRPQRK